MNDLCAKINQIVAEQRRVIFECDELLKHLWVARVAQKNSLLIGQPGTGKSALLDNMCAHISDASLFKVQVHEGTTPSQLVGPTDVPLMATEGRLRFRTEGRLYEATDFFCDEAFNASGPLAHSLYAALNERTGEQEGKIIKLPLRAAVGATNREGIDTDPNFAATFDRWHCRHLIEPLKTAQGRMKAALLTLAKRRGEDVANVKTTVTIAELDAAHQEAMSMRPSASLLKKMEALFTELKRAGVNFSPRRYADGLELVCAHAWLSGHSEPTASDLQILTAVWWQDVEHYLPARRLILDAAVPDERLLDDLTRELSAMTNQVTGAVDRPEQVKQEIAEEVIRNLDRLNSDLEPLAAAGTLQDRVTELQERAQTVRALVANDLLGVTLAEVKQ